MCAINQVYYNFKYIASVNCIILLIIKRYYLIKMTKKGTGQPGMYDACAIMIYTDMITFDSII
jgi:hypothetical protein